MKGEIVKNHINKYGLNKSDISRKMGISPQHLNNILKSPDITTDNLEKLSIATNINLFSLINLNVTSNPNTISTAIPDATNENHIKIPIYNIEAYCGISEQNKESEYIEDYISISKDIARPGDKAVKAVGDSMAPYILQGDIIINREIAEHINYLPFGKTYLISTKYHLLLKVLKKSEVDTKKNILLYSYNSEHQPFELPKSKINKVFGIVKIIGDR